LGGNGKSGSSACLRLLEKLKKEVDVEEDVDWRGGASTLMEGDDCGLA